MAYEAKCDFLQYKAGQVVDKLLDASWEPFFLKIAEKKVVKKKVETKSVEKKTE